VVDLLVTVDAAGKDENDKVDRHVARCVVANLNFYQTHRTWAGSVGGPNCFSDVGDSRRRQPVSFERGP
jgi:hypothetical protein